MPRLSITLTDSQAAALERIAAETGATKQSMIGLAVSAWIRKNDVLPMETPKTPENRPQELDTHAHGFESTEENVYVVERNGIEVGWYRGRLTKRKGTRRIVYTAQRQNKWGELQETPRPMEYEILPDEDFWIEGED